MNIAGLSVRQWADILSNSEDSERKIILLSLSDELDVWAGWLRAEAARLRPSRDISELSHVPAWKRPMWCRESFVVYWREQTMDWAPSGLRECIASCLPEPLFIALDPWQRHDTLCEYKNTNQAWADLLGVLRDGYG